MPVATVRQVAGLAATTRAQARTHRDGVFGLAIGTGVVVGLVALVLAMATGVDKEWGGGGGGHGGGSQSGGH